MARQIQFSTRFDPADERTLRHVPFEVPDNVDQLHISLAYNARIGSDPRLTGGNTLDIGLFDEQGTESGGPGLRGWSGSERTEITIDREWATPPYRAGAPGSGTWHLLFGAYKVDMNGMDIDITVTFDAGNQPPEVPPWPSLDELTRGAVPPAAEPGWYRGDLHMHTVYSDGDSYPHEVAAIAYSVGLDFYGITDHNRAQSPVGLVPEGDGWPVLVPGVEVTTYAGHFNVWGTEGWYDFRDATAAGIQAAVDAARAEGGLLSLNHPKPFGPSWDFPEVTGFDCIEPWNSWWPRLNNMSTGYWADVLAGDSPEHWHVGIGGSDTHKNKSPGAIWNPMSEATMGFPTTWIQTDEALTPESVIDAIRAGRCFISESPSGPQIYTRLEDNEIVTRVVGAQGDALLAIGPHGVLSAAALPDHDTTTRWTIAEYRDDEIPFIRFELHTPTSGIRALSNPVWLG